jgi:hypothetical protein
VGFEALVHRGELVCGELLAVAQVGLPDMGVVAHHINHQLETPSIVILPARWCSFRTSTISPTGTLSVVAVHQSPDTTHLVDLQILDKSVTSLCSQ